MAPILKWEKKSDGTVKDSAKSKANLTCWEAHHGKKFEGPPEPFGRLCYYLEPEARHPVAPTTKP
eukprot:10815178-Karenia_brevis.AAC.1